MRLVQDHSHLQTRCLWCSKEHRARVRHTSVVHHDSAVQQALLAAGPQPDALFPPLPPVATTRAPNLKLCMLWRCVHLPQPPCTERRHQSRLEPAGALGRRWQARRGAAGGNGTDERLGEWLLKSQVLVPGAVPGADVCDWIQHTCGWRVGRAGEAARVRAGTARASPRASHCPDLIDQARSPG